MQRDGSDAGEDRANPHLSEAQEPQERLQRLEMVNGRLGTDRNGFGKRGVEWEMNPGATATTTN